MNTNTSWQPDILGEGFEMCYVKHHSDYSGHVRSTLIRRKADGPSQRGVLYVHGFNDYFFQKEMANRFAAQGYHFYAVDLRKYGRSLEPGQKMFQVRELKEYFGDLRTGIEAMKDDGLTNLTLMGHSTGGLVAALYVARRPACGIRALILNSPFLEWNLPPLVRKTGVPALCTLASVWPSFPVHTGGGLAYARTLARELGGEWDYNRTWKPDRMPAVDAAWVRAIDHGQHDLRHYLPITMPILLLHSDKSAHPGDNPDRLRSADAILDADAIAAAGRRLGPLVTDQTIANALHDIFLSRPEVREQAYKCTFEWLKEQDKAAAN